MNRNILSSKTEDFVSEYYLLIRFKSFALCMYHYNAHCVITAELFSLPFCLLLLSINLVAVRNC